MKIVIMAGGKGTRISSIASDIPKPMIPINGNPILEYEINSLKKQGLTDIVIVVGHLKEVIMDYFRDGNEFGVHISYFEESTPLGTAGALAYLKNELVDDFVLLNGDVLFDIDIQKFYRYHKEKGGLATILTHPNSHPYDSSLVVTDANNYVIDWLSKEDERLIYKNRVNAGAHILSPEVIDMINLGQKVDLDREILKPLVATKKLVAYDSPEYIKDMGTPERLKLVTNDLISGKVEKRNLKLKQRAIFLDRDGTINEYKNFIVTPDQITLMKRAAEAIKMINNSEYLAVIITNQPVIARGDCTVEELEKINNKLETLLGEEGAYIDDIYYCPHHPDKGFEGERSEYKIKCKCRKPEPGMLLAAAERYNIDLSKSYMIGDDERDVKAGQNAGCQSILISESSNANVEGCMFYSDLYEAVKSIIGEVE